ncbi:Protein MKT1 [Tolypocladium capitatum]|uniref:Protein MKT1 n=1 Tax=Tolypocladium capitatum TaxID=45235 RepID=A0A2K3QCR1_9HYPO|nr:Protein MKT1 [Tolypocladium capitatum]
MPFLIEDSWVNGQATYACPPTLCPRVPRLAVSAETPADLGRRCRTYDIAELEDCAIAVDATYYLNHLLDTPPAHEPLLSALGGLTGIQSHINENLDLWDKNRIVPLFVFDGQSITGQDDVSLNRRRAANQKTDDAWSLYSQSQAERAVATFGANPGAFCVRKLYPLLQSILKQRGLHFLVPPYNACAQLAYFELVDSDQCAGVMGPQELLLYPVKDSVIRSFDWDAKTVTAVSKKKTMRALGVSEPMFIDALLMTGTSFLPPFPPLLDTSMYQDSSTVMDAVNMLRTSDKSVATACASFNDILQAQDPTWLDKYRKARMAVHHFIFIAENGEVRVNDFDRLTKDNHEYLGLQLPAELFHYLNTGLIGARNLNCITHGQIVVQPTLDGGVSDEYRRLVTDKILPLKEQALGLIIPRVHRGIGHKDITMRVWFDPKFAYTINHRSLQPPPSQRVGTWDVKETDLRKFFPADFFSPIYLEVLALANSDFVEMTIAKEKFIRGIDSMEMVTSVAIWRFLHLRGYVNDEHKLTKWGNALATTLLALKEEDENRAETPGLDEAALLAFELVRFGVLNGQHRDGVAGMPRKGTDEEKSSLVLISQCATLLKLRHQVYGYTGPLNKSLLAFRSLSSAVREADRDLIEAIVASMFMYGQCKRERDDYLDISQRLPFLQEPDIGLGIAIRTFFDEDEVSDSKEARAARLAEFPKTFVPFAEALADDFRLCTDFVGALNQGVQTLDSKEVPAPDKAAWAKAQGYLDARPF